MKSAVVGSRTFNSYNYLKKVLQSLEITAIISGGARGADTLARQYALENKIHLTEILPNWNLHGKSAGFKRNIEIVNKCEQLVAFWDGQSKGTKYSIELAQDKNKPVYIFWPTFEDLLFGD